MPRFKNETRLRTMNWNITSLIGLFLAMIPFSAIAQVEKHPGAEKAMARIVLQKDYGDQLKFHSREVVTLAHNIQVPGLNGLMFMRWMGDNPGTEILASLQWFEKKDDLLKFYRSTTSGKDYKLDAFDGIKVWKIGENGYSWTDGEHFLISLGGSPRPPDEMVRDWMTLIGSKVGEIVELPQKIPAE